MAASDALRRRVLLLLPTARDAALTMQLLDRNDIPSHACADAAELEAELARGVGAVLTAEEILGPGGGQAVLARALERQPRWSDLPVLLLTRGGADSLEVGDALAMLSNVTLLERPLRVASLVSAVNTALRARARQYEIQSHLQQLESARDFEAQAVRRKDEFLAMLAHELRNPLAPIRNALYVLNQNDSDPERRRELRAMMVRQVEHMVRLVDDLLEASRLSRGMINLQRERIDLRDALLGAIELSRPAIDKGEHTVVVDLPGTPLLVDADPVRIAQVFGNLLNNAAKFSRAKGRIEVHGRREGEEMVVEVRDDGVGIDPATLPHVFELFAQGPREPMGELKEGLGIGLALVRTLVELHDGSVSVHSDGEGRGARFSVRLPAALEDDLEDGGAASPTPLEEARAGQPRKLNVLVVDDNADAAASLAMVLEHLRWTPRVAHDGPAALRMARELQPDVILLDIGMPGMDGYEVARRIRADAAHGQPVLVAVTGWSHEQDLARSGAAGFDHHFPKPVDIDRLAELLQAIGAEADQPVDR